MKIGLSLPTFTGMVSLALCTTLVTGLAGCSSHYIPQSRNRVSTVMVNGQLSYVRDGQIIPRGFLGKGLRRAVRGNAGAERAANTFHQRQRDGLLWTLGGAACAVAGLVYTSVRASDEGREFNDLTIPLAGAIGCLVASYAGLFYMVSAEPYRYDAINLFNDGPAPCHVAPPGGYGGQPGYAEKGSAPCPGAEVAPETTTLDMED